MKQKNLETLNFSLKDEINKLRSLPKGKRWEYFWEYYKVPLFLTLCAIAFLWLLGSFAVNMFMGTFFPKAPISMAVTVYGFQDCDDWLEDCLDAVGYDKKEENMQVLTCAPYSENQDDFLISSTLWFTAGQPDIFICDENTLNYLLGLDMLASIPETWPAELQKIAAGTGWGVKNSCALDISGTAFCRRHGLTDQTVYLCMNVSGQGFTRALDIVKYILTEPAA